MALDRHESQNRPDDTTIVIATGLSNDFIGKGFSNSVHVGPDEAQRLLGRNYDGSGPLPQFLRQISGAKRKGMNIHLISAEDKHRLDDPNQLPELIRYGVHSVVGQPGADIPRSITGIYEQFKTHEIDLTGLAIPILKLRGSILQATGLDLLTDIAALQRFKWVIIGTHSDKRIFTTADLLRNNFECKDVIVCPHLAASANTGAHIAAFQSWFHNVLVRVTQSTRETCEAIGIPEIPIELVYWNEACNILPSEIADQLTPQQRSILETMFLGNKQVTLKRLGGGFSGSALYIAFPSDRSKPVIIKIDNHLQIKRELDGFIKARKYLGNHVPHISDPVSIGEYTGVKIDLATMTAFPQTFQSLFEAAITQEDLNKLLSHLTDTLATLSEDLYKPNLAEESMNPYRQLGLDTQQQRQWLRSNTDRICNNDPVLIEELTSADFFEDFDAVTTSTRLVKTTTTLAHRDLNLANVLFDQKHNDWYIDWTHFGPDMIEIDFAKIENDLKFCLSKNFREDDLESLRMFENFILNNLELPKTTDLPQDLDFIRSDFRFFKIYKLLQKLRASYLAIKREHSTCSETENQTAYHAALLRYSIHTLSFDKSIGRGECESTALRHALISTGILTNSLKPLSDDIE